MASDFSDLIWVVMDGEDFKIRQGFERKNEALRLAASIVGNNSWSGGGDIHLFGPGDGTTTVMVRQIPRAVALKEDVFITPK